MNDIPQLFQYISANNLTNEFTSSLEEQYQKFDQLSSKQYQCLKEIIDNHKWLSNYFEELGDTDNGFLMSLRKQFHTRGTLSKKQIQCLQK